MDGLGDVLQVAEGLGVLGLGLADLRLQALHPVHKEKNIIIY
jgi:hypothetical protein